MNQDLINKYITLPMAIKVLKQDKIKVDELKFGYLYQDLIDTAIKNMEMDFYKLKGKLFNKVKRLEGTKYKIDNKVIEYALEQLKELTTKTIKEYFNGPVEWKEHIWMQ